jgi:hypothetical protein
MVVFGQGKKMGAAFPIFILTWSEARGQHRSPF